MKTVCIISQEDVKSVLYNLEYICSKLEPVCEILSEQGKVLMAMNVEKCINHAQTALNTLTEGEDDGDDDEEGG